MHTSALCPHGLSWKISIHVEVSTRISGSVIRILLIDFPVMVAVQCFKMYVRKDAQQAAERRNRDQLTVPLCLSYPEPGCIVMVSDFLGEDHAAG